MAGSHPLLVLGMSLVLGAVAGDGATRPQAWALVAAAAILCAVCLCRPQGRTTFHALVAASIAVGAGGMGAHNDAYERNELRRAMVVGIEGPVHIAGHAALDLVPADPRRRLVLDVDVALHEGRRVGHAGRVSLRVSGETQPPLVLAGWRVEVWASLEAPLGARSPGAVDAWARARHEEIHGFGTVKSPALITVSDHVSGLAARVAGLRGGARSLLSDAIEGANERGLLASLAFGDRSALNARLQGEYRQAGVFHVLAVSGAQVALLAAVAWRILRLVGLARGIATVVLCASVALYAIFAGGEASILRAAVMATAAAAATSLDLDEPGWNGLGGAMFALVAVEPAAAFDPGFQLSVAATAGLVAFARAWGSRLFPAVPWASWLLGASLAAQCAVLPVQLHLFHTLPVGGLLANIVAVPLASLLLIGVVAFLAIAAVSPGLAFPLAWSAERGASFLNGFVHAWAQMPGIDVTVPTPPLWCLVAYCGGLVALAVGAPVARAIPVIAAGFLGCLLSGGPRADGQLHLFALDVGQGDSLVVVSPHGRVMVVDTGPGSEVGWNAARSVLAPFLWNHGIAGVDRVVISHAHADHVGAAAWFVRTFRVAEVWEGPTPVPGDLWKANRRVVHKGVREIWDGVLLEVLGPPAWQGAAPLKVRNDDSVVLSMTFGRARFLLTGDIEAGGEAAVGHLRYDVVKVPHHGSRTSSTGTFVDATCPGAAFVSVGARNRFQHPDPQVMGRYLASGALPLRTDRDGTLQAATDGEFVRISAHVLGAWSRSQSAEERCATIRASKQPSHGAGS